jgi:hypothetical protein
MLLHVPEGHKVCLPPEILTVARSSKRGLLLEVTSGQGKPYALLLKRNGSKLEAIHRCFAMDKGAACKHLSSAIYLAEKWLNTKLPRDIEVANRWLEDSESIAGEDLTPLLFGRKGVFATLTERGPAT